MTSTSTISEQLERACEQVRTRTADQPRLALVLGSGLGSFADTLDEQTVIPYEEIDGIPVSKVSGHAGNLVFGKSAGVPVVAMQGRPHLYEGHSPQDLVFGTRLMLWLGAHSLIATNAAGGISDHLDPGDLMLIEDHINLTSVSCLHGPNDENLGPRFPDMSQAYDPTYMEAASECAKQLGFEMKRGVYGCWPGPTYETPAEIRMYRAIGADAVGMSTVHEVTAARHMNRRCLGISCVTNKAAGIAKHKLDHSEVTEVANRVKSRFVSLLRGVIEKIGN